MIARPEIGVDQRSARAELLGGAMDRFARVNSSVYRIQKEWSRGVCLVHGAFRVICSG